MIRRFTAVVFAAALFIPAAASAACDAEQMQKLGQEIQAAGMEFEKTATPEQKKAMEARFAEIGSKEAQAAMAAGKTQEEAMCIVLEAMLKEIKK